MSFQNSDIVWLTRNTQQLRQRVRLFPEQKCYLDFTNKIGNIWDRNAQKRTITFIFDKNQLNFIRRWLFLIFLCFVVEMFFACSRFGQFDSDWAIYVLKLLITWSLW